MCSELSDSGNSGDGITEETIKTFIGIYRLFCFCHSNKYVYEIIFPIQQRIRNWPEVPVQSHRW